MLSQRGAELRERGAQLKLQDHGDPVWYRGIKLRELKENDKLDRTPVTPAKIAEEVLKAEAEKLARIVKNRQRAKKKKK